ncbi:hypothetical protein SRABI98_01908 [Microbacterium sp. Bi98]|nr:hypothetical protein SRABI98_01908 [Microbacterium sp. Bi98]
MPALLIENSESLFVAKLNLRGQASVEFVPYILELCL